MPALGSIEISLILTQVVRLSTIGRVCACVHCGVYFELLSVKLLATVSERKKYGQSEGMPKLCIINDWKSDRAIKAIYRTFVGFLAALSPDNCAVSTEVQLL